MAVRLAYTGLSKLRQRLAIGRRQLRALDGERAAAHLLRAHGFAIDDAQVTHHYVLRCDGHPHTVQLRADYLVRRDGQRYIAEVKTGCDAPSLTNAATRRQLLEYAHAYDVDGVLLVDMAAGQIHHVAFPSSRAR